MTAMMTAVAAMPAVLTAFAAFAAVAAVATVAAMPAVAAAGIRHADDNRRCADEHGAGEKRDDQRSCNQPRYRRFRVLL
jgi:hypothetical protein